MNTRFTRPINGGTWLESTGPARVCETGIALAT